MRTTLLALATPAILAAVSFCATPSKADLNPEELVCKSSSTMAWKFGHAGGGLGQTTFLYVHFQARPNLYAQMQPGQCGWSPTRQFKPGEPPDLCADVGQSYVYVDQNRVGNLYLEHFPQLADLVTSTGRLSYYRVHLDTLVYAHGPCLRVDSARG